MVCCICVAATTFVFRSENFNDTLYGMFERVLPTILQTVSPECTLRMHTFELLAIQCSPFLQFTWVSIIDQDCRSIVKHRLAYPIPFAAAFGPAAAVYFILIILIGNYFALNMFLVRYNSACELCVLFPHIVLLSLPSGDFYRCECWTRLVV